MPENLGRKSPLREQKQRSYRKIRLLSILVVLTAGILIAGYIVKNHYGETHKASAVAEIESGVPGYCLDLYRDKSTPNDTVDSWRCNGTPAQNWLVSGQNIVRAHDVCLTIKNNGTTNGDGIVASKCSGEAGQVWVSAIDGYENPASALCLSLPSGHTGEQLKLASCNHLSAADEAWMPATWSTNNAHGSASTACSGTEGQLAACYAAKQWVSWQSGSVSHSSLLNKYSDGNGYEEWCADFVSYLYQEAGYPFTDGERGGWDEYDANYVQYEPGFTYHPAGSYVPQAGDIAYFDYAGGHVEIVAVGGTKPIFIYGDSGTIDHSTNNGEMAENSITDDANYGQVIYYLSPS